MTCNLKARSFNYIPTLTNSIRFNLVPSLMCIDVVVESESARFLSTRKKYL